MTEVGAYEAKTHLSKLLDRVAKGETIAITKHGVRVAMLIPTDARPDPAEVFRQMREFQAYHRLNGLSIREMIEEGRR
ncbi:MAG TPA: type II toxin-antitoxin system prevent-host-death family antitoxin [Armatimonadota bacterium]|jgi:prevent-host-death family protein